MSGLSKQLWVCGVLFGLIGQVWGIEATPEQIGTYTGTAKKTYYDLGNGKKTTLKVPCTMTIAVESNNNVITFETDTYTGSAIGCPLSPKQGGYHEGTSGGPKATAVFKFSGKDDKLRIKGNYHYVNPYVIESGKFSLKKQNP